MDEFLLDYIITAFGDVLREEVLRSFSIFDLFEYDEAYPEFFDILNDDGNKSPDEVHDSFLDEIHKKLDNILNQHTIKLNEEVTSLSIKNEILETIYHIQHLDDYTFINTTLESELPDDEKLANIIAEYSNLGNCYVMSYIDSFSPTLLNRIKQMASIQEELEVTEEVNEELLTNLRLFKECFGDTSIGIMLAESGIVLGASFPTYLTFAEDNIISKDDEATALNILSLLYLTNEGLASPLEEYANHSDLLFQDLKVITRIREKIVQLLTKFNTYKTIQHEKNRLPQDSRA